MSNAMNKFAKVCQPQIDGWLCCRPPFALDPRAHDHRKVVREAEERPRKRREPDVRRERSWVSLQAQAVPHCPLETHRREIASFFLGGTFLLALKYIIQSRSFQPIQARFYGTQFQEQPRSSLSGFSSPSSSSTIDLILILTICIALASVSQFALNIPYDTGRGSAACGQCYTTKSGPNSTGGAAFFTAWAAVASQTTRTVALIQSALDTTYLGAHLEWRGVVLYGWLAIGLGAFSSWCTLSLISSSAQRSPLRLAR